MRLNVRLNSAPDKRAGHLIEQKHMTVKNHYIETYGRNQKKRVGYS